MSNVKTAILPLAWSATAGLGGPAAAQQKEILIGMQCDRTGATQITGVVLCPAMHDYYDLINAGGGVEGYKSKADEIDNEYKVPQAVEAYQRQKQEGAVLMTLYGTPMTGALNQRLQEDKFRAPRRRGGNALSLSVPDRRHLLVAGRCGRRVRQEQTGREPQGQKDRIHL